MPTRQKVCHHGNYIIRRTYDDGDSRRTDFDLCGSCKELPEFNEYVLDEKILKVGNEYESSPTLHTTVPPDDVIC